MLKYYEINNNSFVCFYQPLTERFFYMDTKKLIAVIVGVLLSVAGAFLGYNFKAEVCSVIAPLEAPNK